MLVTKHVRARIAVKYTSTIDEAREIGGDRDVRRCRDEPRSKRRLALGQLRQDRSERRFFLPKLSQSTYLPDVFSASSSSSKALAWRMLSMAAGNPQYTLA